MTSDGLHPAASMGQPGGLPSMRTPDPTLSFRNGRPVWVFPCGKVLPVVSGGAEGDPPTPPAPTPPVPTPPALDLAALQRSIDEATAAGGTAALRPIMDLLGVADEAALSARVEALKKIEDDAKTAEQRANDRAAAAEAAVADAAAASARANLDLLIDHELLRAGVTDAERIKKIRPLVTVAGDVTLEAVAAAVASVKTTLPEVFGTQTPTTPPAPSGFVPPAGNPPPPGGNPPVTAIERGREIARQRHPQPKAS